MRRRPVVCTVSLLLTLLAALPGWGADAAEKAPEPVTTLPAFVVEEARLEPKWQYISHRDFEILTDCSPAVAMAVARQLPAGLQIIDDLVPPELRLRLSGPISIVLDGKAPVRPGARAAKAPAPPLRSRLFVSNLKHYTDQDVFTAYLSMAGEAPDGVAVRWASSIVFTQYLSAMLENATPRSRAWLRVALLQLLNTLQVTGTELQVRNVSPAGGTPRVLVPLDQVMDLLGIPPGARIRRGVPSGEMSRATYTGQLFLHWAWFGEEGKYRARFWEYYRRSSALPEAGEELFQECFGLGYAEVLTRLNAYRGKATQINFYDYKKVLPPIPPVAAIRMAQPAEVARITGEWSRLAGRAEPRSRRVLRDAAERSFERGLSVPGAADARLAGAAGIFFAEDGDDARALPHLQEAARAGLPRARVYLELARIRLEQEKGDPRTGKIAAAQAQLAIDLLDHAYNYSTQEEQYYELLLAAWERSEAKPELHDLSRLRQAAWLFPRESALIARIARLHAAHGFTAEARALGRTGRSFATSEEARAALAELAGDEEP